VATWHPGLLRLSFLVLGLLGLGLGGCGGQEAPAPTDSGPDVPPDAPRVLCPAANLADGGPVLCPPGMICGNSGGVPGNCCCYQKPGTCDFCCPC
jgi:hypothetical protein